MADQSFRNVVGGELVDAASGETYDVLDENQLNAFLAREGRRLGIKDLDPDGKQRLFRSIGAFLRGLDIVEDELLDPARLPGDFRTVLDGYLDATGAGLEAGELEVNPSTCTVTIHAG